MRSFGADLERARAKQVPQLALRHHEDGSLDDVVVEQVQTFRAEQLGDDWYWICCYLPGGERVTFNLSVCDGRVAMWLGETPTWWRDIDSGELRKGGA